MLIAQLSDPHIVAGTPTAEPVLGLRQALRRALSLDPGPDCILITGDLVEHGRPEEYELLREVLDPIPVPVYVMTGNHDHRDPLLDAFAGTRYLDGTDRASYAVETPDTTLVALDSLDPGRLGGRLGAEQLSWLDRVLARRPDTAALVAVHHPPVAVGIPFLDSIRLADGADLATVISAHRNVVRVVAGHVHRPITAGFAGTVLTTAPSTYRQTSLTMRSDHPTGPVAEPTAFSLHLIADGACVTHTVPVSHPPDIFAPSSQANSR